MSFLANLAARLPGRARRGWLHLGRRLPAPVRRLAADTVAARIAAESQVLHRSDDTAAPRILVFQAIRFREDLQVLAQHGGLTLIEAPLAVLQEANGLFRTLPATASGDDYDYFLESDAACLAERKRQVAFYREVLAALTRRLGFDGAMTPAVHYRGDFPWARAFEESGIPFIALHKEFTVIDQRHLPERIELYRKGRFRFPGSWVLVTNDSAHKLFTEGGVFAPERIEVTGLPRMDRLFKTDSPFADQAGGRRQVTLFSFAHYCGGLGFNKPRRSRLFSQNDDEGFVELFEAVHGAIAELAVRHPDVTFKIKPKAVTDWWSLEIDRAFKEAVGKTTQELPNCAIVSETAPELIRDASAVVGFNSTVLLEALALGRATIMPYFAEATETYPYHVYLRDYVDAFDPARSRDDLIAKLETALAGEARGDALAADQRHRCLTYYLGFDDGGSAERVVAAVRRVVASYRDGAATPAPLPSERAA